MTSAGEGVKIGVLHAAHGTALSSVGTHQPQTGAGGHIHDVFLPVFGSHTVYPPHQQPATNQPFVPFLRLSVFHEETDVGLFGADEASILGKFGGNKIDIFSIRVTDVEWLDETRCCLLEGIEGTGGIVERTVIVA